MDFAKCAREMGSNMLLSQYEAQMDLERMCHHNALDSSGEESARWMAEASEASSFASILATEIKNRRTAGTLYDGKRDSIKRIWSWAKGRGKDAQHTYNIVRKTAMDRLGIYMLNYYYSTLFS